MEELVLGPVLADVQEVVAEDRLRRLQHVLHGGQVLHALEHPHVLGALAREEDHGRERCQALRPDLGRGGRPDARAGLDVLHGLPGARVDPLHQRLQGPAGADLPHARDLVLDDLAHHLRPGVGLHQLPLQVLDDDLHVGARQDGVRGGAHEDVVQGPAHVRQHVLEGLAELLVGGLHERGVEAAPLQGLHLLGAGLLGQVREDGGRLRGGAHREAACEQLDRDLADAVRARSLGRVLAAAFHGAPLEPDDGDHDLLHEHLGLFHGGAPDL
mmetsp:Transcript_16519/g.47019  ORF Transcript_16519/g.47019 Transcript_16519/m.47019 type:complete len:271 (+) Transcript_16519:862-1674(+)